MDGKSVLSAFVLLLCLLPLAVNAGRGQEYNVEESGEGQKNYSKEEEGKVLPARTFLTTLEITLLCIFFVVLLVLIVLCCLYFCCFGCVCPECPSCCTSCCKRRDKEDYTQVELQREKKIGEIWKQNNNYHHHSNGR